jgi:pyruvate dehydrogenase E1 component
VRPNPDGGKVGGHQASSASSAAILSALYFETLQPGDRVAIKPHASPVFHAIQYLLGNLPAEYLEKFRAFGGLQAYPSRTKDPERVDFSTGSVGMAGPSAAFAALVRDYLATHGLDPTSGRFFAHIGDAELDQGSVWEAVAEPALDGLSRCVWIVDLNRQSLDRVVPGIRVQRLREMFEVNGWSIHVVKYGDSLTELMERPGGHALRRRIDDMSNEEYQGILVSPAETVRQRLLEGAGSLRRDVARCISDVDDAELHRRIANLGGHDVGALVRHYREAASSPGPAVVFAYTVKGWGLQSAADPRNHAALLTDDQFRQLATTMGMDAGHPWAGFREGSPEADYVRAAAERLKADERRPVPARVDSGGDGTHGDNRATGLLRPASTDARGTHHDQLEPPLAFADTSLSFPDLCSTQDAFGRMLVELDRTSPEAAQRIVTISADVATSTGLATWINRAGVWSYNELPDFLGFAFRTLKWVYKPEGRHIELGLSEGNMMLLLGQLGLAEDHSGRRLIPFGTVYDPFIARGLDQLSSGLYMGSRFILVATPSGVSLSTEGGMHQGVITPDLGVGLPGITYYEPCFARELEWIMLDAVRRIGRGEGESCLLRLSTKPVDQTLFPAEVISPEGKEPEQLRRGVLDGCWRYRSASPGMPAGVNLFAVGWMLPEALQAVPVLEREGIGVSLFCVTSPDLMYRKVRHAEAAETAGRDSGRFDPTGLLADHEVGLPVVTVQDGHPHAMSFLGAALDCPSVNLGVDSFGQSGTRGELYRHFGIDARAVYEAAMGLVDRQRRRD